MGRHSPSLEPPISPETRRLPCTSPAHPVGSGWVGLVVPCQVGRCARGGSGDDANGGDRSHRYGDNRTQHDDQIDEVARLGASTPAHLADVHHYLVSKANPAELVTMAKIAELMAVIEPEQ